MKGKHLNKIEKSTQYKQDGKDVTKHYIASLFQQKDKVELLTKLQQDLFKDQHIEIGGFSNEESQTMLQTICRLLSFIPPFKPYNNIILWWEVVQMIILFIVLISFPIIYFLALDLNKIFLGTCSIFVLADTIIKSNLSYYEMDVLVVNKLKIYLHYFQNGLIYDLIGNISIIYYLYYSEHDSPILLLIIAKASHFIKLFSKMEENFFYKPEIRNCLKVLKLLIVFSLISHLIACSWVFIGEIDYPETWLKAQNLTQANWDYKYVRSIFFTISTMSTIGQGQITPTNYLEAIFVSFMAILAYGFLGYSLTSINSILSESLRHEEEIKNNTAIIGMYMKHRKISMQLQFKVKKYLQQVSLDKFNITSLEQQYFQNANIFRYYWSELKSYEQEKECEIKQILPQRIQEQLIKEEHIQFLSNIKLLKNNFSERILNKIAFVSKQQTYTPEEVIQMEGEFQNLNLCFIQNGNCEIFIEGEQHQIMVQQLSQGQCFGIQSFFSGINKSYSVRSKGFSTITYINRSDFIDICKESVEGDYEIFCQIKDQLLQGFELSNIFKPSDISSNEVFYEHILNTLYKVNTELHINNIRLSQSQVNTRRYQQRSSLRTKLNTLKSNNLINLELQRFQIENQILIDEYNRNYYLSFIVELYEQQIYDEDNYVNQFEDAPLDKGSTVTPKLGSRLSFSELQKCSNQTVDMKKQFTFSNKESQFNQTKSNTTKQQISSVSCQNLQRNQLLQKEHQMCDKEKNSFSALLYESISPNLINEGFQNEKVHPQSIQSCENSILDKQIPLKNDNNMSQIKTVNNKRNSCVNSKLNQNIKQKSVTLFGNLSKNILEQLIEQSYQNLSEESYKESNNNKSLQELTLVSHDTRIPSNRIQLSLEKNKEKRNKLRKQNRNNSLILTVLLDGIEMSKESKKSFQKGQKDILHIQPNKLPKENDTHFYLLKHRNIEQYTNTQRLLDEGFDKMQSFSHYFPLFNSDSIIKNMSNISHIKNDQFNKQLNATSPKILHSEKIENQAYLEKQQESKKEPPSKQPQNQSQKLSCDSDSNQKHSTEMKLAQNNIFQDNFESFSSLSSKSVSSSSKEKPISLQNSEPLLTLGNIVFEAHKQNQKDSLSSLKDNQKQTCSIVINSIQDSSQMDAYFKSSLNENCSPTLIKSLMHRKPNNLIIEHSNNIFDRVDVQIQDMEKDLNSQRFVKGRNSQINNTFTNLSAHNYLLKDYPTDEI